MFFSHPSRAFLAACSAVYLACSAASAQEAAAPVGADGAAVLASSLTNSGLAEANLISVLRDGETITVRVRFKSTEGASGREVLYGSISAKSWESDFYILSGDKKYLLMKDANGAPLAPSSLQLNMANPQAGSWSATFPAPPAGQTAILHIGAVEPLGPFTVPE